MNFRKALVKIKSLISLAGGGCGLNRVSTGGSGFCQGAGRVFSGGAAVGGICRSSFKNGAFLTVSEGRNSASAAELLARIVCVEVLFCGGSSNKPLGTAEFQPSGAVRNGLRFFGWIDKYPPQPPRRRKPAPPP